jgi:hypothetical protein
MKCALGDNKAAKSSQQKPGLDMFGNRRFGNRRFLPLLIVAGALAGIGLDSHTSATMVLQSTAGSAIVRVLKSSYQRYRMKRSLWNLICADPAMDLPAATSAQPLTVVEGPERVAFQTPVACNDGLRLTTIVTG